jgi:hypothetical protein
MPTKIDRETAQISRERFDQRRWWQRLMSETFRPNVRGQGGIFLADSGVQAQGASYLLGQYLKNLLIDSLVAIGMPGGPEGGPVTLAAPVAPIALTQAMLSGDPRISIALGGASVFGIEVFPPHEANDLMGEILIDGLFNPEALGSAPRAHEFPSPAIRAAAIGAIQVHGGIFSNPFALGGLMAPAWFAGKLGLGRKKQKVPGTLCVV